MEVAAFLHVLPADGTAILYVAEGKLVQPLPRRLFHESTWLFHAGCRALEPRPTKGWLPGPGGAWQLLASFLHTLHLCKLAGKPLAGVLEEHDVPEELPPGAAKWNLAYEAVWNL